MAVYKNTRWTQLNKTIRIVVDKNSFFPFLVFNGRPLTRSLTEKKSSILKWKAWNPSGKQRFLERNPNLRNQSIETMSMGTNDDHRIKSQCPRFLSTLPIDHLFNSNLRLCWSPIFPSGSGPWIKRRKLGQASTPRPRSNIFCLTNTSPGNGSAARTQCRVVQEGEHF